jgi:UDP-GlcNAc:undecaprenyl-phosphate GlcNAc-1-phosphate transferase
MSPPTTGLGLFAVSFGAASAAALLLTPIIRSVAWRAGFVASPTSDRWHSRTVAMLGGVPIWLATLLVVAGVHGFTRETALVAAASALLFTLGLVDDVWRLKPATKLSAQIVVACGVIAFGYELHWSESPVLNALTTIIWIVGITNAFNLLDNMDGLCAGVSVIAALAFCGSATAPDTAAFVYAAAVGGATLGFLRFNINPASVFLGDCGSLFLGSTFALLAISKPPSQQTGLVSTLFVPVLILLLPIFDTTFVTVSRKLSARAASRGGRDHTSHRLVAMGFSERQATLFLYAFAAIGGVVAVGLARANVESLGIGFLLLLGLILLAIQLAKVRVYDGDDFALLRDRAFTPLLIEVSYKRRIFEVLLDTCLISIAYYLAYALRFAEDFRPLHYNLFVTSLPIVIACQLTAFYAAGVYRGVWHYITISDLIEHVRGVVGGAGLMVLVLVYLYRFKGFSRSVFIINALLIGTFAIGSRLSFRWFRELARRHRPTGRRALICGAGDGGALLVRELRNNPEHQCVPIGFLDDDRTKRNRHIMGLRVLGRIDEIERIIAKHKPTLIIVSTEKLRPAAWTTLQTACQRTGTPLSQMQFRLTDLPFGFAGVEGLGVGRVRSSSDPAGGTIVSIK